jgi:alanine racemase
MRFFILLTFVLSACSTIPKSLPASPQLAPPNAWIEIDRSAFAQNISTVQNLLGPSGAKVCAVLKADAYGHGVDLLAPVLIRAQVPCAAIASNSEAEALRRAGFTGEIMRIRTATLAEIQAAFPFDVEETIGNAKQAEAAASLALANNRVLRFHLALNSAGMSREGADLKTVDGKRDALQITRLQGLKVVGIMTHFPVEEKSDVRKALKRFLEDSQWMIDAAGLDRSKLQLHAANSFATLEVPESRLDLVRVGGLLYGDTVPSHTEYLRVMKFKSQVAAVNEYPKGNTVSYDRTQTLKRRSRLANIPVGYSNGYRRIFSNKGSVLIRGHRYPVMGRVTMNTILVDVTDNPAIQAGDEVVLFGKQENEEITQAEIEKLTDTILLDLYTLWGLSNPRIARD